MRPLILLFTSFRHPSHFAPRTTMNEKGEAKEGGRRKEKRENKGEGGEGGRELEGKNTFAGDEFSTSRKTRCVEVCEQVRR